MGMVAISVMWPGLILQTFASAYMTSKCQQTGKFSWCIDF